MRAFYAVGFVGALLLAPIAASQPAPQVVATPEGRVADIAGVAVMGIVSIVIAMNVIMRG